MEEPPLVPPGNPLRPRSLLYAGLGFALLVVLTASDAHSAFSVPLGLVATLVASFGVLDFAGCFDDERAGELGQVTLRVLAPRGLELLASSVGLLLGLRLAVAGVLPGHVWLAPLLVTALALAWLTTLGRCLVWLGSLARPAPRLRDRLGFWLMLLGLALYVPWLGGYSLLDPWETHYGEVSREMLARDDWLSFWWAQEGWFWSKPALDFWLQGLAFSLLGVNFRPDGMLSGRALGYLPQPEWAARAPIVLLSLVAVYALYRFVAAAAGKRAGFLSGLALLCMPYWSLLSHQSMTDMPYVAPLTAAISLFGLGLLSDPDALAPQLELTALGRRLRLSAFHGLFALVLLSALPQLAYLLSRNLTLQIAAPPYGFRWHLDELFSGSGLGNCGLPGNTACHGAQPANALFQPALGALLFGGATGYLLHLNRGERRLKRLLYLAAWYFTALAALAKGAPGLVLPLVVAIGVLIVRRQWQELARVELAGLGLLLLGVCLPWYVQEYMRHGQEFTDRLLFHDMYKRAFVHVHDTNTGSDVSFGYYLSQLGYGLFPLTGLSVIGVGLLLSKTSSGDARERDLSIVTVLWLALGFGLFTLSLTKFHHYALPCAPPLAICAGLTLERALGTDGLPVARRRLLAYLAAFGGAGLLLVYGVMRLRAGALLGGVLEQGMPPAPAPLLGGACVAAGLGLAGFAGYRLGARASSPPAPDPSLGVLALASVLLLLLVTRDLSTTIAGDVPASARLLHLITYNYKRSWPASLDFEAIQWAFGLVVSGSVALWGQRRWRQHLAVLASSVCVWFCAFTLWIYLPKLAPHFGQRELFLKYYAERRGPEEPIVGYQMNWKGENFYSGNRLPAFVSSGAKFQTWLSKLRRSGARVAFFVTEHGRIGTLKTELGAGARTQTLTNKRLNDKFALVRVELDPPAPDRDQTE